MFRIQKKQITHVNPKSNPLRVYSGYSGALIFSDNDFFTLEFIKQKPFSNNLFQNVVFTGIQDEKTNSELNTLFLRNKKKSLSTHLKEVQDSYKDSGFIRNVFTKTDRVRSQSNTILVPYSSLLSDLTSSGFSSIKTIEILSSEFKILLSELDSIGDDKKKTEEGYYTCQIIIDADLFSKEESKNISNKNSLINLFKRLPTRSNLERSSLSNVLVYSLKSKNGFIFNILDVKQLQLNKILSDLNSEIVNFKSSENEGLKTGTSYIFNVRGLEEEFRGDVDTCSRIVKTAVDKKFLPEVSIIEKEKGSFLINVEVSTANLNFKSEKDLKDLREELLKIENLNSDVKVYFEENSTVKKNEAPLKLEFFVDKNPIGEAASELIRSFIFEKAGIHKDSRITEDIEFLVNLNHLKMRESFESTLLTTDKNTIRECLEDLFSQNVKSDPVFLSRMSLLSGKYADLVDSQKKAAKIEKNTALKEISTLEKDGVEVKLEEFLNEEVPPLEKTKLDIPSIYNEELKGSLSKAFQTHYQNHIYIKDVVNVLNGFSQDPQNPIFLRGVKIKDASNYQSKLDSVTVQFQSNSKVQSFEFFLPKPDRDGLFFLNGSRKSVANQVLQKPIVKIVSKGEDVVRFTTSYNRIFFSRSRGKFSNQSKELLDVLMNLDTKELKVFKGNSFNTNKTSLKASYGCIEGDLFSKDIVLLKFKNDNFICFDRSALLEDPEKLKSYGIEIDFSKVDFTPPKGYFPIGVLLGKPIFCSFENDSIVTPKSLNKGYEEVLREKSTTALSSLVFEKLEELNLVPKDKSFERNFQNLSGSSFSYSEIKVLGSKIPLISFLGYFFGIEKVLEKMKIDFSFKEKVGYHNNKVVFLDETLFFRTESFEERLLLNGLSFMNTKSQPFDSFNLDKKGYEAFFDEKLGKNQFGKGLQNFFYLFIDPITARLLLDYNIPNDIFNSFVYCNSLLVRTDYSKKNDMSNYRVRKLEMVVSTLYKVLSSSIEKYRRTASTGIGSFSIPPQSVLQEIIASPLVEDAALLNPLEDSDSMMTTTYKGIGGGFAAL